MRLLFTTLYIIAHGLCLAEDLPGNPKKTGTLTVQEAAELVAKANASNGKQYELDLKWLTSIDRDVARELSYYKGQRILLDGLTSISKEVASELTTQRPGWYYWPDTKIPQKGISLDGLTSVTKEVARELAKCTGDLNLNYVKSMDSGVAGELAKFQGSFLNIQKLESIAPENMNILKDGLRRPGSENSYRSMMAYKLKDGTRLKKWNGKIIEYRKDGSKIREIDYKYGGVILRMEWDEAGNLVKEETYPVHKPRGVEVDEQYKSPDWLSNVQLSGTFRLGGKGFASLVTPVGNFWVEEGKFASGYKLIEMDISQSQPSALIQKGDQQAWFGLRTSASTGLTDKEFAKGKLSREDAGETPKIAYFKTNGGNYGKLLFQWQNRTNNSGKQSSYLLLEEIVIYDARSGKGRTINGIMLGSAGHMDLDSGIATGTGTRLPGDYSPDLHFSNVDGVTMYIRGIDGASFLFPVSS